MKNIIYKIHLVTAVFCLFVTSCSEDDAIRVPDIIEAANVRIQIEPERSSFNFFDLENSYLEYNIYSENENIERIEILAEYVDASEDSVYDPIIIKTYTQSDFNDGIITDERITAQELVSALGKELSDLEGGDQFLFLNRTTLTDGRVYPSETTQGYESVPADIRLASATGSYTTVFQVLVVCPPPLAPLFTGEYLLEQIAGPADPFNGDDAVFSTGVVTVEEGTDPGTRQFTASYFEGANFDFTADVTFTFLCGEIIVPKTNTGIGCGGPTFTFASTGSSPYEDTNDEEIIINLLQNIDGACGLPANQPTTLRLTKQ